MVVVDAVFVADVVVGSVGLAAAVFVFSAATAAAALEASFLNAAELDAGAAEVSDEGVEVPADDAAPEVWLSTIEDAEEEEIFAWSTVPAPPEACPSAAALSAAELLLLLCELELDLVVCAPAEAAVVVWAPAAAAAVVVAWVPAAAGAVLVGLVLAALGA